MTVHPIAGVDHGRVGVLADLIVFTGDGALIYDDVTFRVNEQGIKGQLHPGTHLYNITYHQIWGVYLTCDVASCFVLHLLHLIATTVSNSSSSSTSSISVMYLSLRQWNVLEAKHRNGTSGSILRVNHFGKLLLFTVIINRIDRSYNQRREQDCRTFNSSGGVVYRVGAYIGCGHAQHHANQCRY